MVYFFLISCFMPDQQVVCTQTPVANLAVCHALIDATNKNAPNPGGVSYYPTFRCVQINQQQRASTPHDSGLGPSPRQRTA